MESSTTGGSTLNFRAPGGGGNKKQHDIGQAPPCGRTPPTTYPIVKGHGHEASGAAGGGGGRGGDDEGGKEDKTGKNDDVYCPHCKTWFLTIQACRSHIAVIHPSL